MSKAVIESPVVMVFQMMQPFGDVKERFVSVAAHPFTAAVAMKRKMAMYLFRIVWFIVFDKLSVQHAKIRFFHRNTNNFPQKHKFHRVAISSILVFLVFARSSSLQNRPRSLRFSAKSPSKVEFRNSALVAFRSLLQPSEMKKKICARPHVLYI